MCSVEGLELLGLPESEKRTCFKISGLSLPCSLKSFTGLESEPFRVHNYIYTMHGPFVALCISGHDNAIRNLSICQFFFSKKKPQEKV